MRNAVAKTLKVIHDKGALSQAQVADLVNARAETVSRWNQGHSSPHRRNEELLFELEYIINELSDFYEPADARRWIFSRQKHLKGKSPAQLIRDKRIEDVIYLIDQLRDAVYL